MLGNDDSDEKQADIAQHYRVPPMTMRILLVNSGRISSLKSDQDTYYDSVENTAAIHSQRSVWMNMETYTLWLMPCNKELFPLGLPTFKDPNLRIRCSFMAANDNDAKSWANVNQLCKHALSRYLIAWKIDRGDNHEPLDADHEVDSGVREPFSYEETIGLMGGSEAAFERAMENCWLGLALAIARSESMNSNDSEWGNRTRTVEEELRRETENLRNNGWPRGKIAAWLRVNPRCVSDT